MKTALIVIGIILLIAAVIVVVLCLSRKKIEKAIKEKKDNGVRIAKENGKYFELSGFIVVKGKKTVAEAGFDKSVVEKLPKLMRNKKLPIIKVKINGKFQNFVCSDQVFNQIKVYKEHKLKIAGVMVIEAKILRKK